jgi:hypothetical protein
VGDARREAGRRARDADDVFAGPAVRRHDPRLVGQVAQLDVPARKRMLGRQRDVEDVAHQVETRESLVVARRRAAVVHRDAQIELAQCDRVEDLRRLQVAHDRPQAGAVLAQRRDHRDDQAANRGRERSRMRTSPTAPPASAASVASIRSTSENSVSACCQHRRRGRRQPDRAPVGLKQRLADLALQHGELLGHADGVRCSASAVAAIVPRSASSRSVRRRRRSIM